MEIPEYRVPAAARFAHGRGYVRMQEAIEFLRWLVNEHKLEICQYLEEMTERPFFLVAATGLGKTVAVPLHVLLRQMEQGGYAEPGGAFPATRVWVVEPRIPITTDQAAFMNELWKQFCSVTSEEGKPPKRRPALFGSVSSQGARNPDAPIMFITTGILNLKVEQGELHPKRDRVIIDEAHVTMQDNAEVELATTIARNAGVAVDYMSATVDTTTLLADLRVDTLVHADKQRQPVWKHNLGRPLEEALVPLVRTMLLERDFSSAYFPRGSYPHKGALRKALTEMGRAHGMLVVVNSFAGDSSDISRLAKLLNKEFPDLPVLQLAGGVVRDPHRLAEFERQMKVIHTKWQRYVVLATSVVEMGITYPTLDYVVTMDSGYHQQSAGGSNFPVVGALPVNSLLQRIGRVGRKRPGIAYISNEVGAAYASLDDEALNRPGALDYEPIRFPLATASMLPLAYYAAGQEWSNFYEWLAELGLPSRIERNRQALRRLEQQFPLLEELGIATADGRLTDFGRRMRPWIGRADLAYAVKLQKSIEEGKSLPEVLFWTVAAALCDLPIVKLRTRGSFFADFDGTHRETPHNVGVWHGYGNDHEMFAKFSVITLAAMQFSTTLWQRPVEGHENHRALRYWAEASGVDATQLQLAAQAVAEVWRVLQKATGQKFRPLDRQKWGLALDTLPADNLFHELIGMRGHWGVTLLRHAEGGFVWAHQGREFATQQADTPVELVVGATYAAKMLPRQETLASSVEWQLLNIGLVALPEPPAPEPVEEKEPEPELRSWRKFWKWLFG